MADDKAYEDFLNRASEGAGGVQAKDSAKTYKTRAVNAAVPQALEGVEAYYVSEADEPFEVVSLGFGGGEVGAGMFYLPFLGSCIYICCCCCCEGEELG